MASSKALRGAAPSRNRLSCPLPAVASTSRGPGATGAPQVTGAPGAAKAAGAPQALRTPGAADAPPAPLVALRPLHGTKTASETALARARSRAAWARCSSKDSRRAGKAAVRAAVWAAAWVTAGAVTGVVVAPRALQTAYPPSPSLPTAALQPACGRSAPSECFALSTVLTTTVFTATVFTASTPPGSPHGKSRTRLLHRFLCVSG